MKHFLEAGKIASTHGIQGEIRADVWCNSPEFLSTFKQLYLDGGQRVLTVRQARPHKSQVLFVFDEIKTLEQAIALKNSTLYIYRDDVHLEPGEYFFVDLLGLRVIGSADGRLFGTVCDISRTGANDVYHIKTPEDKVVLIPAIPDVIDRVDLDEDILYITPISGLFEDI